jgi:hypothetical protein
MAATNFSPSTPVIYYIETDKIPENMIHQNEPHDSISLNNTNTTGSVSYQPKFGLKNNHVSPEQSVINVPLAKTISVKQINSYTEWSVINIFSCCLCLGFIAFHYSNETEYFKLKGDIQRALNASKKARIFNIIGTVIVIIIAIILILSITRQTVQFYKF